MNHGLLRTRLAKLLELPPLPDPVRHSFRREQFTQIALPPAFALMEGGFVGVIADKIYHVPPWMLAVITAAPMFGNLTSFIWSRIANARPKVPIVMALQCSVLACIGVMALLPTDYSGAWLLTFTVVASRLLMTGVTTVRSVVWSLNYGRELRARTTARLQIIANFLTVGGNSIAGFALDANPDNFRWVYAIGCLCGLLGVMAFSGVIVLRERRHLVMERQNVRDRPDKTTSNLSLLQILKEDTHYRRYQLYQFISGAAYMMITPALIHLVSRELGANYRISFLLMTILPLALSMLTMPLWGYFLDRVHVAEFRSRQSILWIVELSIVWIGALLGSLWIVAAGRVVNGISSGGGNLAWELGHNDFAPKDKVAAYMSLHVTLTGVRGATAPFIGTALYHGFGESLGIGFHGIGGHLFLLSALLSAWSWWGFSQLAKHMKERAPPVHR